MASGPVTETRRLEVAPGRFTGWIESFADRHHGLAASAADGAVAECFVPFPPLCRQTLAADDGAEPLDLAKLMTAHAAADRTVGVFLVRLGGYAAGVFTGAEPGLVASKVGSRLVHGRSAAGGQS